MKRLQVEQSRPRTHSRHPCFGGWPAVHAWLWSIASAFDAPVALRHP